MNGAAIALPWYRDGDQLNDKGKEIYWDYHSAAFGIQIIAVGSLFFFDYEVATLTTLAWLALSYVFSKLIENAKTYFGAKLAFREQIVLRLLEEVAKPILIFAAFLFSQTLEAIFVAQTVASALICVYLGMVQADTLRISISRHFIANIRHIWQIGAFIFIVWGGDLLFRSIDRWYVAVLYPPEALASYGFASSLASNLWVLSASFLTPYAQVLFVSIADRDFRKVHDVMGKSTRQLAVLLTIAMSAGIVFYPFVTDDLVHKYQDSFGEFVALSCFSMFLSLGNMCIYYMTATGNYFFLIRNQVIVLTGIAVVDFIVVKVGGARVLIASASAAGMLIYMWVLMRRVKIDLKRRLDEVAAGS